MGKQGYNLLLKNIFAKNQKPYKQKETYKQ